MTDTTPQLVQDIKEITVEGNVSELIGILKGYKEDGFNQYEFCVKEMYGDPFGYIEITRERYETEEEVQNRLLVQERAKLRRRMEYEELKKEFEGEAS